MQYNRYRQSSLFIQHADPSAEENPFRVSSLSDLFSLAGIWVVLIVFAQLVVASDVAGPLGAYLGMPECVVAGVLAAIYLAVDVTMYRLLCGRVIFQWMVPALWVAAAAVVPGAFVYFEQVCSKC